MWVQYKAPKHHRLTASHPHCTAGSSRSFTAIRGDAGLCCGSRLRKGEVFAYVGRNQNLKDLQDRRKLKGACRWAVSGELKPKGPKGPNGLSKEQFPVAAYVGSSKNLKDLKDLNAFCAVLPTETRAVGLCWAYQNPKDLNEVGSYGDPRGNRLESDRLPNPIPPLFENQTKHRFMSRMSCLTSLSKSWIY